MQRACWGLGPHRDVSITLLQYKRPRRKKAKLGNLHEPSRCVGGLCRPVVSSFDAFPIIIVEFSVPEQTKQQRNSALRFPGPDLTKKSAESLKMSSCPAESNTSHMGKEQKQTLPRLK